MGDNDRQPAIPPPFDDAQWAYILHQDTLMVQMAKDTARLELLTTYYQEITAALHRHPSPELRMLRAHTVARIREVTVSATCVLGEVAQDEAAPESG
jgi:hypothetical protein